MTIAAKFTGTVGNPLGILVPHSADLRAMHFPAGNAAIAEEDWSKKSSGGAILGTPLFASNYMIGDGDETDPSVLQLDVLDLPSMTMAVAFRTEVDWDVDAGGTPAFMGSRGSVGYYTALYLSLLSRPIFRIYDHAGAPVDCTTTAYTAEGGTPSWEIAFASVTDDPDGSGDGVARLYMPGRGVNVSQTFKGPRRLSQSNIVLGGINGIASLQGNPRVSLGGVWERGLTPGEMDEEYVWGKAWLDEHRGIPVT